MGVELDGVADLNEALDDLQEDWGESDEQWVVGTGVEYAVYLEFGTSKMDPKPFFRPAVQNVRGDLDEHAERADSADEFVRRVALALEREIKLVITEKGLIDTGTLRASVAARPGGSASELPTADDVGFDDSGSAIDQGFLAQADVEVNL